MQGHIREKFESAMFMGIIAILVVTLLFVVGHDINTRAIAENGENLSVKSVKGVGFMVVVTIASLLFVITTFMFIISRVKSNRDEELKLKMFVLQCMKRGYSREEAIGLLTERGWTREYIESCLYLIY